MSALDWAGPPFLREVRQQSAEGHAQRTLDVQVEASVLIQVNVAEEICSVGWTLQHIPQVAAIVARVIQHSLPDRFIITEGAGQLGHVAAAH